MVSKLVEFDTKSYRKATLMKTIWYYHKTEIQTNETERPETELFMYGDFIYLKGNTAEL